MGITLVPRLASPDLTTIKLDLGWVTPLGGLSGLTTTTGGFSAELCWRFCVLFPLGFLWFPFTFLYSPSVSRPAGL